MKILEVRFSCRIIFIEKDKGQGCIFWGDSCCCLLLDIQYEETATILPEVCAFPDRAT